MPLKKSAPLMVSHSIPSNKRRIRTKFIQKLSWLQERIKCFKSPSINWITKLFQRWMWHSKISRRKRMYIQIRRKSLSSKTKILKCQDIPVLKQVTLQWKLISRSRMLVETLRWQMWIFKNRLFHNRLFPNRSI